MVPHTADVILEAWAPDLPSCCEEAVAALVSTYARVRFRRAGERHEVHVAPGGDEALLLGVLEEVIFVLDTASDVPVGASVCRASDGGLDVAVVSVVRSGVEAAGSVPKAVSRSELRVDSTSDGVACRFLVDV